MKLIKGLNQDTQFVDQPQGSWRMAKNIVIDGPGTVVNEEGFVESSITAGKQVIGQLPVSGDRVVLFLVDSATGTQNSEIGIVDGTGAYTVLNVQANFLNFNKDYPVSGDFIFNGQGDLIIVFTDDLNVPKILNLKTADTKIFFPNDNIIRLFPEALTPKVKLEGTINGGSLKGGVYYFSFAYELDDGSQTNWLAVTNPVTIIDDSVLDSYNKIDGLKPGENAGKSILLSLTNVDTRYPRLKMAVIKKIDGIVSAEDVTDFVITSSTPNIVYSGDEITTDLLIEEIVADRSSFERAKAVKILNDRLYLGNVYQENILDYQKYANNIVVQWYGKGDVSMDDGVASYKDPVAIYTKRSFMPGEVYALYIRFVLKNGGTSPAFHIPGRPRNKRFDFASNTWKGTELGIPQSPLEDADATEAEYLEINKRAKYFHFHETGDSSLLDSDNNVVGGYCGFWENLDENYQGDQYDSTDIGGRNLLTEGSGNTSTGKVKHHKMPSIIKLQQWGFPLSKEDLSRQGSVEDYNEKLFYIQEWGSQGWEYSELQSYTLFENTTNVDFTNTSINTTSGFSTIEVWTADENQSDDAPIPPQSHIRLILYIGPASEYDSLITDSLLIDADWANVTEGAVLPGTDGNVFTLVAREINATTQSEFWSLDYLDIPIPKGYGIHIKAISTPDEDFFGDKVYLNGDATIRLDGEGTVSGVSNGTQFGNILGLYVRNIQIPESIRNLVTGYEILYAERSTSNALSLGGSVMFNGHDPFNTFDFLDDNTGKYARLYPPDMLLFKPNNRPTHIQVQLMNQSVMTGTVEWDNSKWKPNRKDAPDAGYTADGFADGNMADPYAVSWSVPSSVEGYVNTTKHLIRAVKNTQYLETDNSAGIVDNSFREQALYTELNASGDLNVSGSVRLYVTLQTFKANLYNSFYEQSLVSTGSIRLVPDGSGVYVEDFETLAPIYGGDAFLQPYYQRISIPSTDVMDEYGIDYTYIPAGSRGFIKQFAWPAWTAMNAGLIYEGQDWSEKYFPKTTRAIGTLMPNGFLVPITPISGAATHTEGSDENWSPASKGHYMMTIPQPRNYNSDYTSINNLEQSYFPYDPVETYLKESPNLVARSLKASRIDPLANIRRFLSEDVYEMPKNKGEIWHLDALGDMLLIHQKEALFRTVGKEVLKTGAAEVTIGSGDIFQREPKEIVPSGAAGFAGTTSKYAAFTTKLGYFFVDERQGKVFLLNDTLRELSSEGLRTFFRDNMPLSKEEDNPYFGVGMTAAYDRKYNRIILSKVDTVNPWTVSFSADSDSWVSFHDYNPNVLFSSDSLFSAQADKVWKHNAGNRGIYYVADPYPSFIDTVFVPNLGSGISAAFTNVYWQADLVSPTGAYLRQTPISSVLVYNNYQASGYVSLDSTNVTGNVRNVHNLWKFNAYRDLARRGSVFMSPPFYELDESQLDTTRPWWQRKRFMDQFGAVRLVYNNSFTLEGTQNILYLYSVESDTLPLPR